MSFEPAVLIEGLGKVYRTDDRPVRQLVDRTIGRPVKDGLVALSDVDLVVERGETVGIIGHNGSGKSTLLQIVCGLMEPTTGTATTRGRAVGLLELGAGFDPDFTGRENALLAMQMYGSTDRAVERLAAIEAFARIATYIDRPVREYSSGMFARLAFAVAAHVDADILIVDEILSVGDAAFQQKCMRFLRRFVTDGGTLLLASHSEQYVRSLCRRVLWLDRGIVRALGPASDVFALYAAECADDEVGQTEKEGLQVRAGVRPMASLPDAVAEPPAIEAATRPKTFGFDPDSRPTGSDGDAIEAVTLRGPDGRSSAVFKGGETVDLSVRARTGAAKPVVAFLVRNALGRIVFGDNSGALLSASQKPATVRFRFRLPYLATGNHAVEAYLLDAEEDPPLLIARALDRCLITIQSPHIGGGLANIAPRHVSIEIASGAGTGGLESRAAMAGSETDAV